MMSVTPSRPLRICRVIARINGGGTAVHLQNLGSSLDRSHYVQVTICGKVSPGEIDVSDDLRNAGLEVLSVPSLRREIHPIFDVLTLFRLWYFFRRWKPDIVETHTAKAGTLGRLAARFAGVPTCVHVFHGHVFEAFFTPWKSRFFQEIERWLALRTTRIIALGERQRLDLLQRAIGTGHQVLSIPLGVNLERFKSLPIRRMGSVGGEVRRELGLHRDQGPNPPLIGMFARLVPTKAHEVFLDAAERILQVVPDARFVIVGDGTLRTRLEEVARRQLPAGRVRFLGWRTDTASIFGDLDLIMHTSDSDGMPVAIIEALAAGVPVVATAVGGIPDLIRDGVNGHLVPPRDPGATARAALSILGDPARHAAMAVAARASVVPDYEIHTLAARMDRLYRDLVTQARR